MQLTLTIVQRFKLEEHINRKNDTGHKNLRQLWDLADKIVLADEERSKFVRSIPSQGITYIDSDSVKSEEPIAFDVEKAEARALKDLMDTTQLSGADRTWVPAVLKQLK